MGAMMANDDRMDALYGGFIIDYCCDTYVKECRTARAYPPIFWYLA